MKDLMILAAGLLLSFNVCAYAQTAQVDTTSAEATFLTLEQALEIALSENVSVKVADQEVIKTGYARKGTYSSLYPQINGTGSYQRTIKKQVMYMDGGGFDIGAMLGETLSTYLLPLYAQHPDVPFPTPKKSEEEETSSNEGFSVGRWNTWSAGISASMPLVNPQLWESLKISDMDVELAVEKARSSRLETVTQVKQAFFSCLLAKEVFEVYSQVYENAVKNLERTQMRFNAQRASELDLTRAKTNVANAIPSMYDAESSIILALWQLKAVMGIDLETEIDVAGTLGDWSEHMLYDMGTLDQFGLDRNTTMRQLAIQAEQLASAVKLQKYANIPTLSLAFSYSINAMTNDFKFNEFQWSPYSYAGLSLSIPIFAGGKRASAIKQAKVQAYELELQKANTERQLKIGIRQYLNTMDTQVRSLGSARSAVETAQKAYDIAQKSYEVGRSTLTDLNDAQLMLTQAQLTVSQAIYQFVVAKAQLEQVLGADFIDEDGNVQLNKTYSNE